MVGIVIVGGLLFSSRGLFIPSSPAAREAREASRQNLADRHAATTDAFATAAERAVTVEAWVKLDSYTGCPVLAERVDPKNDHRTVRLGLLCFNGDPANPMGMPTFSFHVPNTVVDGRPDPGRQSVIFPDPFEMNPVQLGEWVHVAATWDGLSDVRMYVNGVNAADSDPAHPESKGNIQDGRDVRGSSPASTPAFAVPFQAQGAAFDPWERVQAECARRREIQRTGHEPTEYKGYGPREKGAPIFADAVPTTGCDRAGGRPDGKLGEVRITPRQLTINELRAGMGKSGKLAALPSAPR